MNEILNDFIVRTIHHARRPQTFDEIRSAVAFRGYTVSDVDIRSAMQHLMNTRRLIQTTAYTTQGAEPIEAAGQQ